MTEALVRVRNDSLLFGPAKPPTLHRRVTSAVAKRAKALSVRAYVACAVFAVITGIGVNALVLQRERHPAPLFAPAAMAVPPAPPASGSAPTSQSAGVAGVASAPAPIPVPPAARAAAAGEASSSPRVPDPIAEVLRGEPRAEGARLTLAAQNALVKLGYAVKPDGSEGSATQEALRDFERAHGLPLTTEIGPRLVRQIKSAARRAAR